MRASRFRRLFLVGPLAPLALGLLFFGCTGCTGSSIASNTDRRSSGSAPRDADAGANVTDSSRSHDARDSGDAPVADDSGAARAGLALEAGDAGDSGADKLARMREPSAVALRLFEDDASATYNFACPESLAPDPRITCLFAKRFPTDEAARALATELFAKFDVTAGVANAHTIDGGFRGMISLVPAAPQGADRKHLAWILASYKEFDAFFTALTARAHAKIPYRVNDVSFRFMRSVGRTTPSAYAEEWRISYNVQGSLLTSESGVRETLFHEIFHLNDQAHGDWSPGALGAIYDPIVKKCGVRTACLTPYAPNDTTVRGGTYYAFQPNNGLPVREYAAELAVRYEKEHRKVLAGERIAKPWKCVTPENKQAWERLRDEFFGGVDLTPGC